MPDDGPGNCLRLVKAVPDYGPGIRGWRQDIAVRGYGLAGPRVHGAAGQGLISFYGWLMEQALTVDPVLLAGPLPDL